MKVFLDCMIYLHYRSIEELDLPSLLSAESVAIVIPRITLRELDKQKNTHQSSKVRDRARRILKKIEQWTTDGVSVRQGVSVEFFPVVPTTDYERLGLNSQWSDDVLIATILEYQKIHGGTRVVLITQDSGPRLTARQMGIPVAELPEEMKLPDEPDPQEVENRELTRRLERVQNALPQLTVCFAGAEKPQTHARFTLLRPSNDLEDDINRKIADLRAAWPKQHPSSAPSSTQSDSLAERYQQFPLDRLGLIEPDEYDRYNRDVDEYLAEYELYMRERLERKALLQRSICFQVEIRNTGTGPADDVDVQIHFPDGFNLISPDDLPELTEEPSPPQQPRTLVQKITYSVGHMSDFSIPSPAVFNESKMPNSFKIERTGSYTVTDHFERIKHGGSVKMREIFLTFDSYESAGSFHCEYTIRPANLPDPVRGELHFVIDKENANDARYRAGEV